MADLIEEVAKAINGIAERASSTKPATKTTTTTPTTAPATTEPPSTKPTSENTVTPLAKKKEKGEGPYSRTADLSDLDPTTKHLFASLIDKLKNENLPFKVHETRRSQERQVYLYRQGRTDKELLDKGIDPRGPRPKGGDKPITWTLNSNHASGRAIDLVLDEDHPFWEEFGSKPTGPWDTKTPGIMDVWKQLGVAANSVGLGWGGKWSKPDYPHVEVPREENQKLMIAKKPKSTEVTMSSHSFPLTKQALQITVEPYQSLVNDTMKALESKRPGYFGDVKNLVLEQGSPAHFGMVRSDEPNTIYLSFQKIQNAVAGAPDVSAMKAALCEVLTHEVGHLKSNFQGGEAPAEAEEAQMRSTCEEVAKESSKHYNIVVQSAQELGGTEEKKLMRSLGLKVAFVQPEMNPDDLAQSLLRIIYHFAQKVDPNNQASYIWSLKQKLYQLDPVGVSGKKRQPGAGIGASISVLKNVLSGEDPHVVQRALQIVYEGLNEF